MKEMLEFYQQQAKANLSALDWLASLQSRSLQHLTQWEFPTRHDEEWKYTSTNALVQKTFECNADAASVGFDSDLPLTQTLTLCNGELSDTTALMANLPKGLLVLPLAQAIVEQEALVRPHLGSILKESHGFHALNTAMIRCGLFIYVPKDVQLDEPLALNIIQNQADNALYLRHLIIMEEGSRLCFVEHYQGAQDTSYLTNTVTEIYLAAKAQLTHYKIQREGNKAFHLGDVAVKQNAHSDYAHHSLSLGGELVRSDLGIYLEGQKAHCLMNGIYAPSHGQHVDHHTTVHHLVPDCSSQQDYKGILSGNSQAVFNGKVFVAKDAQQTNAQQQNKNLLLSAKACVNTKPQLEIFADDVVCSHGATVGQLDEEALFYLATRGIAREEASHYLIHAFAEDNLSLISNKPLAQWMGQLLTEQVG